MEPFAEWGADPERLDFDLLREGSITLYLRSEILAQDIAWLAAHSYQVDEFNASTWQDEGDLHHALAEQFDLGNPYG